MNLCTSIFSPLRDDQLERPNTCPYKTHFSLSQFHFHTWSCQAISIAWTLYKFLTRTSFRRGIPISVTRAGASPCSGTQYEITLSYSILLFVCLLDKKSTFWPWDSTRNPSRPDILSISCPINRSLAFHKLRSCLRFDEQKNENRDSTFISVYKL